MENNKTRLCNICKSRPKKKHLNSKYCKACAEKLKRRPSGTLSPSEIKFAKAHAGDMKREEIAKRLNVSISNLKRSCRGVRFYAHNGKFKERPQLVKQVIDYYFMHGSNATEKAFPNIKVRSIIERPQYYGFKKEYRQKRWTDNELIEAVKMAGIISQEAQAKWFNRPNAHKGSIRSLWMKRFAHGGSTIHGMSNYLAKHLVTKKCPCLVTKYWAQRRNGNEFARKLYLWVDMEKHLRDDVPEFIRSAIKTLAEFQRWIFKSTNPRQKIIQLLKREPKA